MGLTRAERETIIRRAEDEQEWDVFTAIPAHRRLLAKRGWTPSDEGEGFYRLPKRAVVIRSRSAVFHEQPRARTGFQKRGPTQAG